MGAALTTFFSRLSSTLALWGICGATMYWAFEPGFWLIHIALVLRALWEFFGMLDSAHFPHFRSQGMILGTLVCIGSLIFSRLWNCEAALHFESAALSLSVLWIFIRQIGRRNQHEPLPLTSIAYTLLGVVYISFLATFCSKLLYLTPRSSEGLITGHYYLLFLAIVTKFSDIGAYVTGSLIGKTPLIPHISPKKTREGFLGAIVFSTLGALALVRIFPSQLSLLSQTSAVIIGLIFSVIAVLGDLAESILKRSTGIKDSGHFLPGIGGALDLIDSLLFTGPLLYFYLTVIAHS